MDTILLIILLLLLGATLFILYLSLKPKSSDDNKETKIINKTVSMIRNLYYKGF